MKKVLFLALAAAAMVSCSNEDVISLNQEVIGFENAFVDNSTRVTDPSITSANILTNGQVFNVYGTTKGDGVGETLVQIFNGVPVTYTDATSSWGYAAGYNQYWIEGNLYNFAALVNATPANVGCGTDLLPQTVKFTSDDATDLLYARSTANIQGQSTGNNDPVAFTFSHILSKVYFSFKNEGAAGSGYSYRVTDVEIDNAYKTATCDVTTFATAPESCWSGYEGARSAVAFGNINGNVEGGTTVDSENARLLIPNAYIDLNISCTVETLYNGSVVNTEPYALTGKSITLVAGHAYNFILSKGAPGDLISFTVTGVNGWSEDAAADLN